MSSRERGHGRSSNGIRDIGTFVENYNSLLDKLYPVFAVWDAVLYVARWENYLITLAVMLMFSFLFYFPTVLLSLLTLSAILVMGVGRYHGQTKAIIALREPPAVELLDPDQQALKQQHSEQGRLHKSRLEFRQILLNAEIFILNAGKLIDYVYSVYLWKSAEVSLCVTVLLCVLLVLLCTVSLQSIGAALPIIILCTNKHFFLRSIDLWKQLLMRLKRRLERRVKVSQPPSINNHLEEQERGEEDESEMPVTAAEPHTNQLPEEHDCNNETSHSEASSTPELRHRAVGSQASTEQTSAAIVCGETVKSGESASAEGDSSHPTRKDGKAPPPELCSKCQTSFFLKRKHDCNRCGQTFCGSCTVKVTRAALGATSPTAKDTSVRVCLDCKAMLDSYACSRE